MIRKVGSIAAAFAILFCGINFSDFSFYSKVHNFVSSTKATSSTLTTFRTENLKISLPSGCTNAFEEAFMIMKSYFLHRHKLKDSDWENLKARYGFMTVSKVFCNSRKAYKSMKLIYDVYII